MNTDRLTSWLALGANVGVLIGLILLVVELNQNREMMMAQTRNEISQGEMSLLALTAESKELADIVTRANRGEDLDPAEWLMWNTRSESVFRLWQNVHYQGRKGMYDQDEFAKHLETMESVLAGNSGLVRYWCDNRAIFPSAFAASVDGLVSPNACISPE